MMIMIIVKTMVEAIPVVKDDSYDDDGNDGNDNDNDGGGGDGDDDGDNNDGDNNDNNDDGDNNNYDDDDNNNNNNVHDNNDADDGNDDDRNHANLHVQRLPGRTFLASSVDLLWYARTKSTFEFSSHSLCI